MSPEKAHGFTMKLFGFAMALPIVSSLLKRIYHYEDQSLSLKWKNINFKNPVGLAAGFDKNGDYIELLNHLGFGFIEVGTVTPKPQEGNPKPRLFRLPKNHALINRMGFNNEGIDALVDNLKKLRSKKLDIIIGGNIGKNKVTPNETATDDYVICFEALYDLVDYFVVNVSSPNTPNLRALQDKEPLKLLLSTLLDKRDQKETSKPILLKIAPDLNDYQLNDIIELTNELALDGIIAANTTIDRSELDYSPADIEKIGAGGLSGAVMKDKSTHIIHEIRTKGRKDLFIIGVGGIESGTEAKKKIAAGANIVQIYTGLIYQGPGLIKQIKKELTNPV